MFFPKLEIMTPNWTISENSMVISVIIKENCPFWKVVTFMEICLGFASDRSFPCITVIIKENWPFWEVVTSMVILIQRICNDRSLSKYYTLNMISKETFISHGIKNMIQPQGNLIKLIRGSWIKTDKAQYKRKQAAVFLVSHNS